MIEGGSDIHQQEKRLVTLGWVLVSFGSRLLTSLLPVGTVMAARSLAGANAITLAFLLLIVTAGFNTALSGAYLVRKGAVQDWRSRKGWGRRDFEPAGGSGRANARKLRFIEEERLRRALGWQRRRLLWARVRRSLVRRLRYQRWFYLPYGRRQYANYLVLTMMTLVVSWVDWYCTIELSRANVSVSVVVFLSWAANCWLAILWVRKAIFRPTWSELAVPAIGVLNLVATVIAAGLLSEKGLDAGMLQRREVWLLVANSFLLAGLASFSRWTRVREERLLHEDGVTLMPEDGLYLSVKLTFWPTASRLLLYVAGYVACGAWSGFPRVENNPLLLGALVVYALGCIGNRINEVATVEGEPALNGIGRTGGLGFTFLWTWLVQGTGPRPFQLVGASMALGGMTALAFTEKKVRVKARTFLRRQLRYMRKVRKRN